MAIPIPFVTTNVMKALIVPFKNKELTKPIIPDIIVVPVNPETYNETLAVNLDKRVSSGQEVSDVRYLSTDSQILNLNFTLDGTNTIEGYANPLNLPVLGQIERLKKAMYYIDGSIHRPRFLKVIWGTLIFNGVLQNIDFKYTLFNPVGIPIRAQVGITIAQHQDRKVGLLKSILQSPDVTHVRDLKSGQRLDQMTSDIYNDVNLVLQVAKANELTSFRNIGPGTTINLPPIDKEIKS